MIRLAREEDGAAMAAIYRPFVAESATSFETEPPDGAEMARRVARLEGVTPWLVCERHGAVAGYAYAGPHRERPAYRWATEVSAYVHADARRSGIASALYAALLAVLKVQGYRVAYAGITLPNHASVRMHEAAAFTPVGVYRGVGYKRGAWHDVLWLERDLAPRTADPDPPVPLSVLVDGPEFGEALLAGTARLRFRD